MHNFLKLEVEKKNELETLSLANKEILQREISSL